MTTKHHENDIERFDQWASTNEHSWLQRAFFDRAHQATLALAAGIVRWKQIKWQYKKYLSLLFVLRMK
jgi:hypothetical protein